MKGIYLILCLMLARDIAGSIFRPQFDPRMANLVVQPLELLSEQQNIEQHQRNRHHHPRHQHVSSEASASLSEDSRERVRDDDTSSDYHRLNNPIHAWNSALYSTVIGQPDDRQNYADIMSRRSKEILEIPLSPVSDKTNYEKSAIFYDSFITMKHMTEEEKNRFHDAYQTAVQTSNEDVHLNSPRLIEKHEYEVEKHTVKTDDGYILTLFRIPAKKKHGSDVWAKNEQNKDRSKESNEKSKETTRDASKEHSKENSKESRGSESQDQSNENSKELRREESKERSGEDNREHSKEKSKEHSKEQSGENSKEHSREKSKEHSKEQSEEKSKERSGEDNKEHSKERSSGVQKAPIVFLMHGLLGSSDDWLLMGPDASLAYLLADAGFDVWLGNARGNKYSRRHVSKHPAQPDFWQFTTDEIALHDLPAMIDYVLKTSKQQNLVYVGHSQGTTAFFALTSTRPEYKDKIKEMYAISPMAYMDNVRSPLLRMFAVNYRIHGGLNDDLLGKGEFNPNEKFIKYAGGNMCEYQIGCKDTCSNVLFVMAGINPENVDVSRIPVIMGHLPAGTSVRQMKQYGQAVVAHDFRKYDYGVNINNELYGQSKPPKYDMSKVKVPVSLYYSENDWLSHPKDVERLRQELPNVKDVYEVPEKHFTHTDFQFSEKAPEVVYKRLIKSIKKEQE